MCDFSMAKLYTLIEGCKHFAKKIYQLGTKLANGLLFHKKSDTAKAMPDQHKTYEKITQT